MRREATAPVTKGREAYNWSRSDSNGGVGVDIPAILHRRRKSSIRALMFEFEREIEPLLPPDAHHAIRNFKDNCRKKLNGLTFEAVELMKLLPGESLNEHAVDLAEHFGDTTED